MNWSNMLKAPYVQPFSQGSTRIEGKLVGHHPLPLVGSYLHYIKKLLNVTPKKVVRESFKKWWKHGRIKVVGGHEEDKEAINNPEGRNLPLLGIQHMRKFIEYTAQLTPPTWEEFISKIDDKEEFTAASVIFGDDFPKNEQDMRNAKWLQPSFRYKKPKQQAFREQRHVDKWEQEYQTKVDKVYKEVRQDFKDLTDALELLLITHRNSEIYKQKSDPRLRAYFFLKEVADELPNVTMTESQKGVVVYITPTWDEQLRHKYRQSFKQEDKAVIRMKLNPSSGRGQMKQCLDLMRITPGGRKTKIHTVCLTSQSTFKDGTQVWVGDFYVSILLEVHNTKTLQEFQDRVGNWTWQSGGNPKAASYIDWTYSDYSKTTFIEGLQLIDVLHTKFNKWGEYWVDKIGSVKPAKEEQPWGTTNAFEGVWDIQTQRFRRSNDKNLIVWEDILKTSQRKVRQSRTSTVDLSALTEHSKHNLLPNWVQNNTRSETKYGVQVQYKAFIDMFKAAILSKNDRLLLCSWYLRSYIPKIHFKLQSLLTGSGKEEMYNPFDSKKKPKVRYNPYNLIPIKSITGKLLSYVYIKYDKTGPSIEFITLVPNTQHAKVKNATVLDLGDGQFEPNWENNEFIKNHIRNVFGAEEVGETPPPSTTSRTIGDIVDEEKKSEWWATLKEGGPITSAKAGITNMTYGKGAQKPKKKKKFKPKKEKDLEPKMPPMPPKPIKPEKEHEIIPDEPDFWRD